jgi:PAP2 superfamily
MTPMAAKLTNLYHRCVRRIELLDAATTGDAAVGARRMRWFAGAVFTAAAVILSAWSVAQGALPNAAVALLMMFAIAMFANRLGRFLSDWAPVLLILFLYLAAYGIVADLHLPVYYTPQLDADKLIGLGRLPTAELQSWIGHPPLALEALCTLGYVSHFFFPLFLGFYLWSRSSRGFSRLMYGDIVVSALAAVTQTIAPTAPPWLAAQHGLAPGVHDVLRVALSDVGLSELARFKGDAHAYNVVAAFPSIHAAFPLIGLMVARRYSVPGWLRIAQLCQLLLVWFVIVYTGEHYVIDIIGGVVYAIASLKIVDWVADRLASRSMRAVEPPVRAEAPRVQPASV